MIARRRIFAESAFLCVASVTLSISSEIYLLGLFFVLAFLNDLRRQLRRLPTLPYRKWLAYGAILPASVWWALTPSVEYGVSPFIAYIPGWYLLFLAFLQKRSLGKGGYESFVFFDGLAAMLLGLYQSPRIGVWFGVLGLMAALYAYSRPRTALYKRFLFILLFLFFVSMSFLGVQYWKTHRAFGGRGANDFYERTRVLGFDPAVSLGSFSSNYVSRYNDQVVLRVWDSLATDYLRAAVYDKYMAGVWKLPETPARKLYAAYYQVEYAVFESLDSATRTPGIKKVWVQSSLNNFGFLFAPASAFGVACKNLDSLDYFSSNTFVARDGLRSDWFYFVGDSLRQEIHIPSDSAFLAVHSRYDDFLDSVATSMGLERNTIRSEKSELEILGKIRDYFIWNFKYSLVVSKKGGVQKDPLISFWKNREGYCEYFATLSTLLLRRLGVPARYVTGFARPERVSGRPYVQFRRKHSHAWVEVFVDGAWMVFDPTPPSPSFGQNENSWLKEKWEGFTGWAAYLFHSLRDGEWREMVYGWQEISERFLTGSRIYTISICFVFLFVILVVFRKLRKVKREQVSRSEWARRLDFAERNLAGLGFVRQDGETVSSFERRVSGDMERLVENEIKREKLHELLQELRDYEANRWKLGCSAPCKK